MRRKINRLYPLFLVLLIVSAGIFLARSNFFQIKSVTCELDKYPCPLIYEPVLVNLHRQNILNLSRGTITQQFQALDSGLAEVKLQRTLPDKIHLKLIRRSAVAKIEMVDGLDFSSLNSSASATISGIFNGTVFFLDNQGAFFPGLTETNSQVPVISLPAEKIISLGQSDLSQSLLSLINALTEYFISSVKIIWLPPAIGVIQVSRGPYAVIDLEKDIFASAATLQYILSGFRIDEVLPVKIDLRFEKPILSY